MIGLIEVAKKMRVDKGLTQQEVAEKTGMSRQHISQNETKYISWKSLNNLADILGYKLEVKTFKK